MEIKNKKIILISFAFIFILVFSIFVDLAYASEITAARVINLVNGSRNDEGLVDLNENETLNKIARDKLDDMIKNNYFAHTSPKGATPWSWFEKEGYDYKYAGENLAINFLTAEGQHKAWMESPTHKKNIMNPKFFEIGVAVGAGEINKQMAIITVQEFGTLAGAGEAANKKENFSGKEKKDVLKEDQKIAPTVLSVKEEKMENFGADKEAYEKNEAGNNYFSDVKNYFAKNANTAFKALQMVSMAAMLFALLLMPSAFIFEAAKTIMANLNFGKIFKTDPAAALK
ncbi:MAG TPA: CAP domain-containing protein [Candidatus Moranbacteria bacterium]|nr:CAP domain-containing protein [Candidatus Moranbacteria bacterium]